MPLVTSSFSPPVILRSPHTQTIVPALFRKPAVMTTATHSLETSDSDILLYRHYQAGNGRLAIVSHGLEGSFDSSYVRGMVKALLSSGWDVLTWNMRGCGDMPNRLVTWYHSGKSEDLKRVVAHACALSYDQLSLVGFSVGGNITLKYLGEESTNVPSTITCAVVLSVPMDLEGSADALAKPGHRIYMQYLLRPLRRRMRHKKERFPTLFDIQGLSRITTFHEFDRRFTAPFHGFRSIQEYWSASSSLHYLTPISVPTLALSALDDPFLSPSCFPHDIARTHPHLYLETPKHGGHVGFWDTPSWRSTWAELRILDFLRLHSI
jgi:predicted alpha/beta-fold hydrolase